MALADLDDLAALGANPVDADPSNPEYTRALRLLELASGLVLAFLDQFGVSKADIEGGGEVEGWESFRREALAGIVAEIAAKRLNVAAAPNVDPYAVAPSGPQTIELNRWEQDAIRDLLPGGGANASTSVVVERDFSWITGVAE